MFYSEFLTMRLFTAIDLSDEVRSNLGAVIERLKPSADISWSPVRNLHITTKFVGEWAESRLEELKTVLAGVKPAGAFDVQIKGLGWFPNPHNPRVFWAAVHGGAALSNLAKATDEATSTVGIERESRPFTPHLTLARIRDRVPLSPLRQAVAALESTDFGSLRADMFYLYLSAGGKYTRLAEFPL